ncbi:hypothetical protein ScPMuIL_008142 [Solemya velum]
MDPEHRKILQSNRRNIIQNLHNLMDVVDRLLEERILTESMREEIEVESPIDGKRKLLDILPKRGARAFTAFCEALELTDNPTVTDILDPQGYHHNIYSSQSSSSSCYSPREQRKKVVISQPSRDDELSEEEKCVVVTEESSQKVETKPGYESCSYDLAVIVNNISPNSETSGGRDKDFAKANGLFKNLGFDVKSYKKKNVMDCLKSGQYETRRCLILLIMSVDGEPLDNIDMKEVFQFFTDENCPSLAGRPKIIILQRHSRSAKSSCQEESEDELEAVAEKFQEMKLLERENLKDIFFIASTPKPGRSSWKPDDGGSWFIQSLVEAITDGTSGKNNESLENIMRKVESKTGEVDVHCENSLTSEFYFKSVAEVTENFSPIKSPTTCSEEHPLKKNYENTLASHKTF